MCIFHVSLIKERAHTDRKHKSSRTMLDSDRLYVTLSSVQARNMPAGIGIEVVITRIGAMNRSGVEYQRDKSSNA